MGYAFLSRADASDRRIKRWSGAVNDRGRGILDLGGLVSHRQFRSLRCWNNLSISSAIERNRMIRGKWHGGEGEG